MRRKTRTELELQNEWLMDMVVNLSKALKVETKYWRDQFLREARKSAVKGPDGKYIKKGSQ